MVQGGVVEAVLEMGVEVEDEKEGKGKEVVRVVRVDKVVREVVKVTELVLHYR